MTADDPARVSAMQFNAAYEGVPPWDIGRPQPAFEALVPQLRGRVLDAGCGTGEHALMAAAAGHEVTGVDAAPRAIAIAEGKAIQRGLTVRFMVADALDLDELDEEFDTVLDSGLFHVFGDDERERYVAALRIVLVPGGRIHLMCFSDRQPGTLGPRRVTRAEIEASFAEGFQVDAVEPAQFQLAFGGAAEAWLATITRT